MTSLPGKSSFFFAGFFSQSVSLFYRSLDNRRSPHHDFRPIRLHDERFSARARR